MRHVNTLRTTMTKLEAIELVKIHGSFLERLPFEHKSDPDIICIALDHSECIGDVVLYLPPTEETLNNEIVASKIIKFVVKTSDNPLRDLLSIFPSKNLYFRRFCLTALLKNGTDL